MTSEAQNGTEIRSDTSEERNANKQQTKPAPEYCCGNSLEYQMCWDAWRFGVSLRFTTVAFWITLTFGILHLFFSKDASGNIEALKPFAILFGILSTLAVITIENRNREIYGACLKRAAALELEKNKLPNTNVAETLKSKLFWNSLHWGKIKEEQEGDGLCSAKNNNLGVLLQGGIPPKIWSWHTGGLNLIYYCILAMWLGMFIAHESGREYWAEFLKTLIQR